MCYRLVPRTKRRLTTRVCQLVNYPFTYWRAGQLVWWSTASCTLWTASRLATPTTQWISASASFYCQNFSLNQLEWPLKIWYNPSTKLYMHNSYILYKEGLLYQTVNCIQRERERETTTFVCYTESITVWGACNDQSPCTKPSSNSTYMCIVHGCPLKSLCSPWHYYYLYI